MGSSAVAALIAHVTFWLLLVYGWLWNEVRGMTAAVLVSLWIVGWLGLPYLPYGAALFSSYVAVLDIALVFIIFKGDVTLT